MRHNTGPFVIQVVQVLVLETVIGMAWQFNVFVKTDIYFVLCNYFSYPDLDKDARTYLLNVLHKVTLGRFGREAAHRIRSNLIVLQTFSWSGCLPGFIASHSLYRVPADDVAIYPVPQGSSCGGHCLRVDGLRYDPLRCLYDVDTRHRHYMWIKHR